MENITEETEEEQLEAIRKQNLTDVLADLGKYRMNQTDPISQIANIPNATDEAKQIAMDYLHTAMNAEK
jgi:hypothetical protein